LVAVALIFGVWLAACSGDSGSTSTPVPQETDEDVQGTGSTAQYTVAQAVGTWCSMHDCDFMVGLGDNVYPSGVSTVDDPKFQTAFEEPYADLDFPFYLTLGNHDYVLDPDAQVAYTAHSEKWKMPARSYTFTKGEVFFAALDTQGRGEEQRLSMIRAIESSDARWKIAYGHHPLLTNGGHGNASGTRKDWLKSILCNRVDFFLAGHDHNLQHISDVCGVALVVAGAGGAWTYGLNSAENSVFAEETRGFSAFHFAGDHMTMRFVDSDANLIYRTSREKQPKSHSCGADGFCDQLCSADVDCEAVSCLEDGQCERTCSDDPDCWGTCACDYYPGICEVIENPSSVKCGCDPACAADAQACVADEHCDTWCPDGVDPDC
jgi:tartrate-resistant acid phosphatase type 5